ncbi:hypothetical protein ES705_43680 [subsurface metagenome]
MSEREKCGDFEIYFENNWWIVKKISDEKIIGKFLNKDDALSKIASVLQSDENREETESVC